ncbi:MULTISPECIES: Crp/Fnr family transcriptional regulator [Novosphingobium]|uniref:Cyclic nucleotide-binding protein n=1 Tax=Novosphingobium subterraneum TaxID=48936 RepID=A0A0B9ADQ2_9SPHN|nr:MULTISPECIES: Crp/Fnr family transcriptional regulator [Novosphingobium]KHS48750.1 cyclic nucleotide-binding protein [Novosphingobium subterraneum]QOV93479.1 Crp/Fnr family transcriptional regulator [Novosphingobium sp. ES2-1]
MSSSILKVPDDVQAVLALHGRQMRVRKGQVLLAVGLPANDVYVVLEGSVSVSLVSAQGRETVLRAIGPREMFGELAAIDGEPRSADVVAVENSTLLVIPGPTFAGLLGVEPVLSLWLARYLSHQVRYLTNRIYELSTMGVGPRLQAELLRLAGEPDQAGAATINRIPTQAELAARIGTNRETVTREFSLLIKEGLVMREGRRIVVPSVARLADRLHRYSQSS